MVLSFVLTLVSSPSRYMTGYPSDMTSILEGHFGYQLDI